MPDLIAALLPFFGILILLVVVVGLFALFAPKRKSTASYPYQKQDSLFTPAERSFLGVLEQAVGSQNMIFGKVRLADVIKVKRGLGGSARQSAFNRIQSKHLDYVVCDSGDLSIQFVVELDDKSHARRKTRERDVFVDQALKAAAVTLFRFPAKQAYLVKEIKSQIGLGQLEDKSSLPY